MHNNYYLFRLLSNELHTTLRGSIVSACFSQNKDELIIRFELKTQSLFIKADLQPQFSCLSFPNEFARARKNSIDLFPELIGLSVISVFVYENERSFQLEFNEGYAVLFKMHGNRSNLILLKDSKPVALFKKQLSNDLLIEPEKLHRTIDWSFDYFSLNHAAIQKHYFTFGKLVWEHLEQLDFHSKNLSEQYALIQQIRHELESGTIYLTNLHGSPALSLIKTGAIIQSFTNSIEALNAFYLAYTRLTGFEKEKAAQTSRIQTAIKNGERYIAKNKGLLQTITQDSPYKIWADLLMANLHTIKAGSTTITLNDFYTQQPVTIKLKPELSAQKNAELFYRKARNQQIEIDKLTEAILIKETELEKFNNILHQLENCSSLSQLRALSDFQPKTQEKPLPYHQLERDGFVIRIGKNAAANDELTFKHSFKEDLWLHAKDVSGSHVLIKYQAGKSFPKTVIERAAQLAAFHSKRKTETLCPVIVTPKKFVRKRKGDPAGAVVVDREEIIMIEPIGF